ncbi:MAG: thioredoxin [Clostridia bacterium]|nr:thioredoxin [Clostridia bacterium]
MENVDVARFDELLKGEKPVVCDFYATWCGPCKMLAPVMEGAAEKYSDKAVFIKVDIDNNFELAARYGVTSIPLVGVFKNGELADSNLGYASKSEMDEFLANNL